MIPFPPRPLLRFGLSSALAAAAFLSPAAAQTIPNPGFETDTNFTVFPGYSSDNGPITGWGSDALASSGLNPSGGSPFADNGAIPQGTKVAFIQSNGGASNLYTTITGLTPAVRYRLQFRLNARNGQTGALRVSIDGSPVGEAGVFSVGGATTPYKYAGFEFEATGSEALLMLENYAAGDNTIVVDDFTIAPTMNDWSYEQWFDDTDAVDPAYRYTHAYSFNSTANPIINEVQFTGVPGGNPAVVGKFSTTGLNGLFANDTDASLSGQSKVLGNDFIYNGFPSTFTLNGLTPGKRYVLTLYSVAFDPAGARVITFRDGASALTIDQDAFGNNAGIRIIHNYTADANGDVTVFTHPLPNASFHVYGFSNREADLIVNTPPAFTVSPQHSRAVVGETVTLNYSLTGTRPIDVQWLKNGNPINGETGPSLTVSVNGASEAAFYSVRATNTAGTVTSPAGFIQVYESAPGPLFSTGVDATGVALAPGSADPHYRVTTEPDGNPPADALVQSGIPSPPWVANTQESMWIGFTENTGAGAPGDYVYSTTVNMTGINRSNYLLTGRWSVDNFGSSVLINGVESTVIPDSPDFLGYTWFEGTADYFGLTTGVNNVDFLVTNGAPAGPTGLKVSSLKVPDGTAPVIFVAPSSQSVVSGQPITLNAKAYGSGVLRYQWTKGGSNLPSATGTSYTIPAFSLADNGQYAVKVTNLVSTTTSPNAQLTASDVPPEVTQDPQGGLFALGDTVTLNVAASGSAPFTYQWFLAGNPIPSATSATYTISGIALNQAGAYTVRVTNNFGNDLSAAANVQVRRIVPGVFNTGVDDTGTPLEDGVDDPHYQLTSNPNSPGAVPAIQAVVHSSTVWPIVAGPWLANSAKSKWIGPAADTAGALGTTSDDGAGLGIYVYKMLADMTGLAPASALVKGRWAVDNVVSIWVNGTMVDGVAHSGFDAMLTFTFTGNQAAFVNGINTIEFRVLNDGAAVGPTALRVEDFRIFADAATTVNAPPVNITLSPAKQPVIRVNGVEGKRYRILRSTTLQPVWSELLNQLAPAGGVIEFTDTNAPAGRAFYIVEFETP